jgi:hypothetical protein
MAFNYADDTVTAKEGELIANIDGRIFTVGRCDEFSITGDFKKTTYQPLGQATEKSKITGITLKGTMSNFTGSPEFAKMVDGYKKTKKQPYFKLTGRTTDLNHAGGNKTVTALNCLIDGATLLKFGGDDVLKEDVAFTFDDYTVLDDFNQTV